MNAREQSPLIPLLQAEVPPQAQRLSAEHVCGSDVDIEDLNPLELKALVHDDGIYRVTAIVHKMRIWAACTCLRDEAQPRCCGHIWTALKAWDMYTALPEAIRLAAPPRLVIASDACLLPCKEAPITPQALPPHDAATDSPQLEEHAIPAYVIDRCRSLEMGELLVQIWTLAANQITSVPRIPPRHDVRRLEFTIEREPDRDLLRTLRYHHIPASLLDPHLQHMVQPQDLLISAAGADDIMQLLLRSSRLYILNSETSDTPVPLRPSDGPPWEFALTVSPATEGDGWQVTGHLRRDAERMSLEAPVLFLSAGWFFKDGIAPRFEDHGAFAWLQTLRHNGVLNVPSDQENEMLEQMCSLAGAIPIEWPESLGVQEIQGTPRPRLRIAPCRHDPRRPPRLQAKLSFEYDGDFVEPNALTGRIRLPAGRRIILRDRDAEERAKVFLMRHGARPPPTLLVRRGILARGGLELMPVVFAPLVRALLREGWRVEAEGKLCRAPSQMRFAVSSGIDWLDLDAEVMFDALRAGLNDMVDAAREERGYVVLSDGSLGVLPEEWLGRYLLLLTTGRLHEGRLRFKRAQLALLDALLADMPHVTWDKALAAARRELPHFEGVAPLDAPAGFAGTLRPYQKEALGWFGFLARFGLGGCLADDMGLGKTVQVLALLESWRAREGRRGPALVVAPRSVASNWSKEAARFTPALRTVMHLGPQRARERGPLEAADLVITTYDTMVRDIELLAAMSFDYAILDEAQAIKNPSSMRARAARGLNAAHRLALTGTPIENHVGELWSLLEFLNPGMVGTARAFRRIAEADAPETVRRLLARVLRPLILRRTKGQVAPDLPVREEHTVLCELDAQHRREYEELRARWRAEVCRALDAAERGGAAFKVLEALLRLRQAACHPGLVDAARRSAMSAKLDVLLEHVGGLVEGGAKALIFSQFTSLLDIVRKRLDSLRIAYEYLDGRTRNRAERVERFQTDPACPLFLISIKAGGLGLNLTAAEYVFILDPWWNPAVEAQAIDRAHRIGQQRTVLAYRLIARDTVEERVIELQQRKRQLVDAIMQGHAQGLADLNREDLEFLFS